MISKNHKSNMRVALLELCMIMNEENLSKKLAHKLAENAKDGERVG